MTGSIFIEARPVRLIGAPLPAQHLYLVQRDDIGSEYVLSATASRTLPLFGATLEVEVNRPIESSNDARGSDTPAARLSTELAFDLGTDAAWTLMVKYAREIDAADYDYRIFSTNSNAFVGAMIAAAGGEPDAMLPEGLRASAAVGYASFERIAGDIRPPTDGSLRGTPFADVIDGIQVGDVIFGYGGDDTLRAGRGDDRVYGGTGNDTLTGGAGADELRGGRGHDRLWGQGSESNSGCG